MHGSGQPRRRWAGSPADLPAAYARPYLQPGGTRLSVYPDICEQAVITPCVSLLGPYPNSAALARLPTSQECGPPASTRRLAAFSGLPARPQLAPAAHGVGRPGTGTARFSPGGGPPRLALSQDFLKLQKKSRQLAAHQEIFSKMAGL